MWPLLMQWLSSKCYTNFLHLLMQWVPSKGYMNLLHLRMQWVPWKGYMNLLHWHSFLWLFSVFDKRHLYHFYDHCKSHFVWTATSLVFLKLNDIALYYQKKIFLDTKKFHCLWVGHIPGMATNPYPPPPHIITHLAYDSISWLAICRTWIKWLVSLLFSNQ